MIVYTPPTDARDIPVIDLAPTFSPDPSARKAVAWDIRKACRNTGFFYVKNHGLSATMMTDQIAWARCSSPCLSKKNSSSTWLEIAALAVTSR